MSKNYFFDYKNKQIVKRDLYDYKDNQSLWNFAVSAA
jgi:hypothetical protein